MNETFYFNGISSADMGVVLADKWVDSIPAINYVQDDIDGRDGAIYTPLNLMDTTKTIRLNSRRSNREEIQGWLRGSGIFRIGNRQRQAYLFEQTDFQEIGKIWDTFEITMILEPYWYPVEETWETLTGTSVVITNNGNAPSTPKIRVSGTGSKILTINGILIGVDMNEAEEAVIIDCKEKTENYPKAVHIGFEYPTLAPGDNTITMEDFGGSATVEICRKDRWFG